MRNSAIEIKNPLLLLLTLTTLATAGIIAGGHKASITTEMDADEKVKAETALSDCLSSYRQFAISVGGFSMLPGSQLGGVSLSFKDNQYPDRKIVLNPSSPDKVPEGFRICSIASNHVSFYKNKKAYVEKKSWFDALIEADTPKDDKKHEMEKRARAGKKAARLEL